MRSCKNDELEHLGQLLQRGFAVRTHVDAGLGLANYIDDLAGGEGDGQRDVALRTRVLVAVDQRFIQIEHQRLFVFQKAVPLYLSFFGRTFRFWLMSDWAGGLISFTNCIACSDWKKCSLL